METALAIDILLPRLNAGELRFLMQWSADKSGKFPHFSQWLCILATDEAARRLNEGHEPSMIPLPVFSDGDVASDFLLASYCLQRQPLTESLAKFVDEVAEKIIVDIAGHLSFLGTRYQA